VVVVALVVVVVVVVVVVLVVVVVVVVVVLVAPGAKQSGIASGKLAPTMQRAITTTVSPSVAERMMFRKLRTCACPSSLISCPRAPPWRRRHGAWGPVLPGIAAP
jgi:hypothetical protein